MPGKRIVGCIILLACVGAGISAMSCDGTVAPSRPIVTTIGIPGAEYVGMDVCMTCHTKQAASFRGTPHSHIVVTKGENDLSKGGTGQGCESCHGPGSIHVANRGGKGNIVRTDWYACTSCHLNVRNEFQSKFHHPVPEGRMTCSNCHDSHSGMRPVSRAQAINDTCFECHPSLKGPWTFPHSPIEEDGCIACHSPHGTNIRKQLVANTPNLCLRCHADLATFPTVGAFSHGGGAFLVRGCENCHRGLHGSNFSDALRYP